MQIQMKIMPLLVVVIRPLGFGGGGAGSGGGSCCSGGGGFNGGCGEGEVPFGNSENFSESGDKATQNGIGYLKETAWKYSFWAEPAGCYYGIPYTRYKEDFVPFCLSNEINLTYLLGGIGGCGGDTSHRAGCGGIAGSGGLIHSENNLVFAYNGNRFTDGTDYRDGENQALIYAQQGIKIATCDWEDSGDTVKIVVLKEQSEIPKTNYINPTQKDKTVTLNQEISFLIDAKMTNQGVGSGAGYIEVSNGTYEVDSSLN